MTTDVSPAGRALQTLELLQANPGITAGQVAERLNVTGRAARRYVAMLREADIPVESTRGPYGGYVLGRGVRLPPLMFSAVEALGLVMSVLEGSRATAETADPVGSALDKIIRALPRGVGRQAATMRRHARSAPRGPLRTDPELISALAVAIDAGRQARIDYRSQSGRQWTEHVDPWAVIVRHGRWYLLCWSHRADDVRCYRIDRIAGVAEREQRFEVPAEIDYVDVLERHLGIGWEYETRVVFDAPYDEVAPYVTSPMGNLSDIERGTRCVLTGTTSNPTMYAGEWLAAIPIQFHVDGGLELRNAVTELSARLAASTNSPI